MCIMNVGFFLYLKFQRSSLPLQMLLYFNSWYFGLCFFLNLALFTYKGMFAAVAPVRYSSSSTIHDNGAFI